jgi:hypothetical protein
MLFNNLEFWQLDWDRLQFKLNISHLLYLKSILNHPIINKKFRSPSALSLRGGNASQCHYRFPDRTPPCNMCRIIRHAAWHFQLKRIEKSKCFSCPPNHQCYSNSILLFLGYFLRLWALVLIPHLSSYSIITRTGSWDTWARESNRMS